MEIAKLAIEGGGMLFVGMAAFFGVKQAVAVIETKVEAFKAELKAELTAHVGAINQRITDLASRVK